MALKPTVVRPITDKEREFHESVSGASSPAAAPKVVKTKTTTKKPARKPDIIPSVSAETPEVASKPKRRRFHSYLTPEVLRLLEDCVHEYYTPDGPRPNRTEIVEAILLDVLTDPDKKRAALGPTP